MTARVTLWHNPHCSKSRQALALLEQANVTVDVRRYLDDAPTVQEIGEVLRKLGMGAWELVRRGESAYAACALDGASDEAIVAAMAKHPVLIERPIAIVGSRAAIGRPPERVVTLLDDG